MKSAFPEWIYDGSEIPDPFGYGEEAVDFLRKLKHPNSSAPKSAFQLYPFQERIVRRIYGPRHPDGRRIVNRVFWMIGRGNRKTSLAASLALLHTIGPERVRAGQVIFAASNREQASIGFREAANIVRMDKRLKGATRIYDARNAPNAIRFTAEDVTLQAIASDGKGIHGSTPSFVLADEIHVWPNRDLWEGLKQGLTKTANTLMIVATTAGRGNENVGFEEYSYARKIATGEVVKPDYLPIIFEADAGTDWRDEALWHRVNPGLQHGFPNIDELRSQAAEAEHRPAERHAFEQFNLCIWKAASRDPLFDMAVFDEGFSPLEINDALGLDGLEPFEELPAYVGVDLSVNGDLTAIVAAWKHDDGRVTVQPWFFLPGDGLEERAKQDRVPYPAWRDAGYVTATAGPIIEPEAVEAFIRELCARFTVREVAFDPHLARTMMARLHGDGIPVVEFRQSPLTMGPAIGDLERTVNGRKLRHNGHPVLRHHLDSVVASRGDTGLTRMHKADRFSRIDGAVAAAMAVSRAVNADQSRSIYDHDELWQEAA